MPITQLLKLLLLTGFLSGCYGVPIKHDAPGPLGDLDLLQSLIGQKSESVVGALGLPNELLSDGDRQFMIYLATSADPSLIMFIWVPMWACNDCHHTLHCLRFELDSDNLVAEYHLESRGLDIAATLTTYCRGEFWSKQERKILQKATDFPSAWRGIENQRYALIQFRKYSRIKPKLALIWLCESADPVVPDNYGREARVILGNIFEFGGHIWFEEGVVERNYKLAYVWYALSGKYDREDLNFFADQYFTSKMQVEAKKALKEWRPGNCKSDLGLE